MISCLSELGLIGKIPSVCFALAGSFPAFCFVVTGCSSLSKLSKLFSCPGHHVLEHIKSRLLYVDKPCLLKMLVWSSEH